MMTDGNESVNAYFFHGQDGNGEQYIDCGRGLTKREYFAAMAMQGLLSVQDLVIDIRQDSTIFTVVSHNATRYADALIAELQKEDK